MDTVSEKIMISAMPEPGSFRSWSSEHPSLDINMDVRIMYRTEARDDGDEECYHEYYSAVPYGHINGTLFDERKAAFFYHCSAESFESNGAGNFILILHSIPPENPATKMVLKALPYLISNLYGIFPDVIIAMP